MFDFSDFTMELMEINEYYNELSEEIAYGTSQRPGLRSKTAEMRS